VRLLIAFFSTLILALILTVENPDLMIEPGRLSESHRQLDHDCFRCHGAMQGAAASACLRCHKLPDIGRRTSRGVLLPEGGARKVLFHAALANPDCLGCHTLHLSERHRTPTRFQHDFLAATVRADCRSCHERQRPRDALHRNLRAGCAACHRPEAWRPASIDHQRLPPGAACVSCHQSDRPQDELHRQVTDSCGKCHGTERWRPATFDHARYFRFDQNHPADCKTCHLDRGTFATYSCYGCHEHSPAKIAAEHQEEGIRSFENCARCHRSGEEGESEHREGRREGAERGDRDEDDD
jgi:hypothetical protein